MHEIEAAQRDLEEEAQGRDLRVHLRRPAALCELVHLEAAQIIPCCRIGRAAEKAGESLNVLEVIVLRLLAEPADGHVLKHAAAKIADRLVAHWGVLVLRLEVDEPLDPQDETLPITLPAALPRLHPRRLPTPQQAGARATLFSGTKPTPSAPDHPSSAPGRTADHQLVESWNPPSPSSRPVPFPRGTLGVPT